MPSSCCCEAPGRQVVYRSYILTRQTNRSLIAKTISSKERYYYILTVVTSLTLGFDLLVVNPSSNLAWLGLISPLPTPLLR
jgi:hypothetical protein